MVAGVRSCGHAAAGGRRWRRRQRSVAAEAAAGALLGGAGQGRRLAVKKRSRGGHHGHQLGRREKRPKPKMPERRHGFASAIVGKRGAALRAPSPGRLHPSSRLPLPPSPRLAARRVPLPLPSSPWRCCRPPHPSSRHPASPAHTPSASLARQRPSSRFFETTPPSLFYETSHFVAQAGVELSHYPLVTSNSIHDDAAHIVFDLIACSLGWLQT